VIDADWAASPPRELWRKPVGPGWSSFAVVGDRLYTQEQRGENEAVVCMEADTGKEIWAHLDDKRFSEPVAGAGPRATPTFHDGRIYAQGATGVLNCLDARTGAKIWSADIAKDSGAAVPMWGFSASPLVLQGLVIVFAGGPGGKAVHAYKADTGEAAWAAGEGKLSYCSPQAAKIGGVEQILFCTEKGLVAFSPTGGVLWQNDWAVDAPRVVQPALVGDSDVLLGTGMGNGTRRVHVEGSGTDWKTSEVWLTKDFKPYFNDLVIAKGHLYGFDGEFFTCVDLEKGEKRWKARGYGSGQVLLLAEQNLLLVLSEKGEVALLEANPQKRVELPGKFQAIQGKTWNHPVVAHGKLFVRNGEEMACYKVGK
jgi:outer membrane protein assembly factor BamB